MCGRRRTGKAVWETRRPFSLCALSSSSAKAEDPVCCGTSCAIGACDYWMPAFASMTGEGSIRLRHLRCSTIDHLAAVDLVLGNPVLHEGQHFRRRGVG